MLLGPRGQPTRFVSPKGSGQLLFLVMGKRPPARKEVSSLFFNQYMALSTFSPSLSLVSYVPHLFPLVVLLIGSICCSSLGILIGTDDEVWLKLAAVFFFFF